jgi:hypothetical protein
MAFMGESNNCEFVRRLGSNELFCHFCHNAGNLNVMTGLTLLTRHPIDEGDHRTRAQQKFAGLLSTSIFL